MDLNTINLELQPPNLLIKYLKVSTGTTTKQLAERAGIAYATLIKIEAGTGQCTMRTATKLSEAFNLNAEVLLVTAHKYNQQLK